MGLDGSWADAQELRDFLDPELVPVAQYQRDLLSGRQFVQPLQQTANIGTSRTRQRSLTRPKTLERSPQAAPAQRAQANVRQCPQKPWLERSEIRKSRPVRPRSNERLLHRVLGLHPITQEVQRDAMAAPLGNAEQPLEGIVGRRVRG
jgi:hypothetical protein